MKLGILVCDHVQQQLQGEFGDYPQMFKDTLLKVDESLDIELFEVVRGQFPTDIDQCDAGSKCCSAIKGFTTDGMKYVCGPF